IAADLWTSSTMELHIMVTAHYITNTWKLKARLLCTALMPERHSAANIAGRLSRNGGAYWCFAQSMLAIKTGLVLPDVVKAIDAARRVVCHFCQTAVATCALKKWQEELGLGANKLQIDCLVRWNSTVIMLQPLLEQRIAVQSVLADETVSKPNLQMSLTIRASWWELLEQLIPALQPSTKATKITCGKLHAGLSFIYPNTVRQQLQTRFKLESDDLMESSPTVARMLNSWFKDLQFIQESKRDAAQSQLNSLLQDEGELLLKCGRATRTDFPVWPSFAKATRLSYPPGPQVREFFLWLGIPSCDSGRAFIQPTVMPSSSYTQTRIEKQKLWLSRSMT
ncbi:zinc finger BED domain-containing protein 1-like, partial [Scleropages formosus]